MKRKPVPLAAASPRSRKRWRLFPPRSRCWNTGSGAGQDTQAIGDREIDQSAGHDNKQQARQRRSIPMLEALKRWLEQNVGRVPKASLTHQASTYTLKQWSYLAGYCEDGQLHSSNALAENAMRPFAVGRRAWLLADTSHGARVGASGYSLVETAKANNIEPHA